MCRNAATGKEGTCMFIHMKKEDVGLWLSFCCIILFSWNIALFCWSHEIEYNGMPWPHVYIGYL